MDHELQSRKNLLPQARAVLPKSTEPNKKGDAALSMKGKQKTEEVYRLRQTWRELLTTLLFRVLGISYMVAIFALGGIGLTFSNKDRTIVHGLVIDGDALLAVMGIVSTITTIIAGWTFQHLSGTILTTWMTGERGATPSDLHLEEELKNPIAAFSRFKTAFKRGDRLKPLFRLCITAVTGICVLLVAASVNTIAIPKSRWYPDPRFGVPDPSDDRYYFDNQTSRVGNVSFMNTWGQGFAVVREGGLVSWEMSHILAASNLLHTFGDLHDAVNQSPGWHPLGGTISSSSTVVSVSNNSDMVSTASIHGDQMNSLYNFQKRKGSQRLARDSIGWYANASVPAILLETKCQKSAGFNVSSWQTVATDNATMDVRIGAYSNDSTFQGARCTVTIQQCLFALEQWKVSPISDSDGSSGIDESGARPLPPSPADADILKTASTWFNDIVPNLQGLSSNKDILNFTSLTVRVADSLAEISMDYNQMDGLAFVVGSVFSSIITGFEWTYSDVENSTTRHGPVRWQVYGSGPRLPWEWVIGIVPGVLILVHLVDIGLLLKKQLTVGPWLKIEGMMVAASTAPTLSRVSEEKGMGIGQVTKGVESMRIFMREFRSSGAGPLAIARMVDKEELSSARSAAYGPLQRNATYGLAKGVSA